MNVQYHKLLTKIKRIRKELEETATDLNEALSRPDVKHGIKMDKTRRRVKDAILHLQDVPE